MKPKLIGSLGSCREFVIALESHCAELSYDLTQIATLTTNDGRTLKPAGWLGAGHNSHHREGVLAFEVPPPGPGAVELKIAQPVESAPRTFRWQLKSTPELKFDIDPNQYMKYIRVLNVFLGRSEFFCWRCSGGIGYAST